MWITPAPRKVQEGRSVVFRTDRTNLPQPPAPKGMAFHLQTFQTSQLNDASFSPMDPPVVRPYPGVQSTRRTPEGKPAQVSMWVPAPVGTPGMGHPGGPQDPYAVVKQYKRPGQMGMVWTDPETQQSKPVETLADLRDYFLGIRGQLNF